MCIRDRIVLGQSTGDTRQATVHLVRWLIVVIHDDQYGVVTDVGGIASENGTSSTIIQSIIYIIWFSAQRLNRPSVGERDRVG